MGLEVTTLISGLNPAWPLGATDLKSAGDDHIRLLKAALQGTFPAITGAVTVSHTVLNAVQDASSLNAGVLADARVQQSNVTQHQAALGTALATASAIVRRDASGHIWGLNFHSAAAQDDSTVPTEVVYRGADGYYRAGSPGYVGRYLALAWTIAADPGTTPSGSPGQVFAYY